MGVAILASTLTYTVPVGDLLVLLQSATVNGTVTTGTLVNAAGGTITAVASAVGGGRTLTATLLDNFGTLNVSQSLSANTAIDQ